MLGFTDLVTFKVTDEDELETVKVDVLTDKLTHIEQRFLDLSSIMLIMLHLGMKCPKAF